MNKYIGWSYDQEFLSDCCSAGRWNDTDICEGCRKHADFTGVCQTCDSNGYIESNNENGDNEVQRCDDCELFPNDEQAQVQAKADCKVKDYIVMEGTRWEKKLGVEIESQYWDKLRKSLLEKKDMILANDWVNAVEMGQGWNKYCRLMYSADIGKLRNQTMMEFYGKGIVD